jgi:aspartyl-tRNA(Asn)/glutamyl-tRNA(Gln) amidotransferase subunit A
MPRRWDGRAPCAMRIGLARNFFFEGLDPQIRQVVDHAVSVFAKLGAEIHEVALPVSSDRTVIQAEGYAYHAGNMAATPELYLPETLSKLRRGASIDMETYIKARLSLDQVRRTAPYIFRELDAVLTPTTPVPAPTASELPSAFDEVMANDAALWRNTRPFNLLAFPTISIPLRVH